MNFGPAAANFARSNVIFGQRKVYSHSVEKRTVSETVNKSSSPLANISLRHQATGINDTGWTVDV